MDCGRVLVDGRRAPTSRWPGARSLGVVRRVARALLAALKVCWPGSWLLIVCPWNNKAQSSTQCPWNHKLQSPSAPETTGTTNYSHLCTWNNKLQSSSAPETTNYSHLVPLKQQTTVIECPWNHKLQSSSAPETTNYSHLVPLKQQTTVIGCPWSNKLQSSSAPETTN